MRKHCIYGNCFWPLTVATLLLLLQLASGEQQAEDHRIQRRFMWQQMDNTVMGSLMGRMFNGARAMKSIFSDYIPSTSSYAKTMMDFMPTETTRVKYIIRDPHTNKAVKVIKMRGPPKKVVKLIRPMPKPAVVTEPPKLQYEHRMRQLEKEQELIAEGKAPMSSDEALMDKYFKPKTRQQSSNEIVTGKIMEYQSWKPVYKSNEQPTSFVTLRPQALTQLHTQITSSHGNHESHNNHDSHENHSSHENHGNHGNLDSHENHGNQDYQGNHANHNNHNHHDHQGNQGTHGNHGNQDYHGYNDNHGNPDSHELLPKPEKLVAHRPELEDEDDDFEQVGENENELYKQMGHQYEVTEHTGEASGEVQALAPMEGGFVPSKLYHSYSSSSHPITISHPSSSSSNHPSSSHPSSSYHSSSHPSSSSSHPSSSHPSSSHPSSSSSHPSSSSNPSSSSHSSHSQAPRPRSRGVGVMSTSSTTTTESPNYPPAFLKKYREREQAATSTKPSSKSRAKQQQHKEFFITEQHSSPSANVSFSMSSMRARLQEQQRPSKQEERDDEMEAALVDAMKGDKWPAEVHHSGSYLTSPIGPSAVAFEQPLKPPRGEYKRARANVRQRGSVKFSDNPNEEM